MRCVLPALLLILCGCDRLEPSGSSVTVKLPPPKAAQPAPGFAQPITASTG